MDVFNFECGFGLSHGIHILPSCPTADLLFSAVDAEQDYFFDLNLARKSNAGGWDCIAAFDSI